MLADAGFIAAPVSSTGRTKTRSSSGGGSPSRGVQARGDKVQGLPDRLHQRGDVKGEEWGKKCKTIRCLEGKGLRFCYECDAYLNCDKFRELSDPCLRLGMNLMENLDKIKAGRAEEWL